MGLDGFRNVVRFVITGLDVEAKAQLVEDALWRRVGGKERFAAASAKLVRAEAPDPATNEAGFAYLVVTVVDPDPDAVGRAFSNAAVELALANYPGFLLTEPPRAAVPNTVFWPATIPAALVSPEVTCDGVTTRVSADAPAAGTVPSEPMVHFAAPEGETVRVPLGRIVGARSGDKGGDANLGVWTRRDEAYEWLGWFLTVERLAELLPEARGLTVHRHLFPNLRAVNFVLKGFLDEGAASSTRFDPQAKTLGEYLRAKVVEIPEELLAV